MVDRDVGDHGHTGLERVGRVPRAAESHLDDGDVDREVREPRVRRRGQHLEVRRMQVECVLDDRDGAQQVVELVVGDGNPLIRDAFVDVFQMRARVRTDREADRAEQLRHHARGRRLPVRSGEVHRRILELRRPEVREQRVDAFAGRSGRPAARRGHADARLEVDVALEPGAYILVEVFGHGCVRRGRWRVEAEVVERGD